MPMHNEISIEMARDLLPPRPHDAHKGTFGHLLVIAGSRGFTGAAKLAAESALRSGAGLVTIATPAPLQDVVATGLLEAMSLGLFATPEHTIAIEALDAALAAANDRDAVAIGPGLSQNESTQAFVRNFVVACTKPMIIDADGLNALAGFADMIAKARSPIIVTPHPGEMARLVNKPVSDIQQTRETTATAFAQTHNCVVVLKGHHTVVACPHAEPLINRTGNSGLASGGTGDVLTGLIGGLLAQGCSTRDAAILGVYVHGLAGDLAAETMTQRGMIAGDVIESIPSAWALLETGDPE